MDEQINIAAILKDKPKNTKLWSPALGEVRYDCISKYTSYPVYVKYGVNGNGFGFTESGKIKEAGECLLFPSKEMRDWEKFAWQKGDVVKNDKDHLCIFDSWASDDYTLFYVRYYGKDYDEDKMIAYTRKWSKVTDSNLIKQYISDIEEVKGGKLNLSTLEIEYEPKPVKKHDFQPFDKVLVRNAKDEVWLPRLFAYEGDTYIVCTDGNDYQYCIPYNESTKHLLGTTKDWEGGEV